MRDDDIAGWLADQGKLFGLAVQPNDIRPMISSVRALAGAINQLGKHEPARDAAFSGSRSSQTDPPAAAPRDRDGNPGIDLTEFSIVELRRALGAREVSPVEVTRAFLDRASAQNPTLNCYVTLAGDRAVSKAQALEALSTTDRDRLQLFGIPVAFKDNIATKDLRTTAGSPLLKDWIPTRNADVVSRLERAGAVVIGKLNMYQFALRSPHPDFGDSRNPWDHSKSCAGSSSGSGCAVASGVAAATLGTDTAGSLRIPAAVCGVVGLKPTYGLVSTTGIFPNARALDHVGPLTRTAEDALLVLSSLARRPITGTPYRSSESPAVPLRNLKIGIPKLQADTFIDEEMEGAYHAALAALHDAGSQLRELEFPSFTELGGLVMLLALPAVAAVHERYLRASPEAYSPEVRQQILLGSLTPASAYVLAQNVGQIIVRAFDRVMNEVDVLALPVIPMPAWSIDATQVTVGGVDHDLIEAVALYTAPFNITGQPAVSVPCGFTEAGLPLALQLVGRRGTDASLLEIAAAYQRVTNWHLRRPTTLARNASPT